MMILIMRKGECERRKMREEEQTRESERERVKTEDDLCG